MLVVTDRCEFVCNRESSCDECTLQGAQNMTQAVWQPDRKQSCKKVTNFAQIYQCEQGGQILAPKMFPSFSLLNLAIYIAVFRGFMVFLVV